MTGRVRATVPMCRAALKRAGVSGKVYPIWGICTVTTDHPEDAARALRDAGFVVDVDPEQLWIFSPS